jgi:adenylate kinase
MKKLFLIIGAPCSGKTTDAELIAAKHNDITHYSTGDLFRTEVASNSDLGKEIDTYVSAGNLVPISIVIDTIIAAIKNAPTPTVIIDGYPRSTEQMIELDKFLSSQIKIELMTVIEIEVSEKVLYERVVGRNRGADDNIDIFKNRMKVYTKPLEDIQKFYEDKDILHVINGERTIEEIVDEMDGFIQSHI